jgi:tRNA-binding EMAP/Myf-like protein
MNKIASIEKIKSVRFHPNADRLDLITVLGYQCVTQRGLYKEGDIVIYIQPDSILPEAPWAEDYRKYSPKRIKAVKLRGEWSEGILVSKNLLEGVIDTSIFNSTQIGNDVSHLLGVTHYEPPAPQELNAKGFLPHGIGKTDEERCISGDAEIMTNLGLLPMSEVYHMINYDKLDIDALSYNHNTQTFEFKPITQAVCNFTVDTDNWIEITLECGKILKCTDNHRIYSKLVDMYVESGELKIDDLVGYI